MQIYPPGTRIGQYEIDSPPLIGSMGMVYICRDHGNADHPVALKTFRPEFLPKRDERDNFLGEGSAWIELGSHPHIVRCYDVKYLDPITFLILELINKEHDREDASLRAWIGQPMPVEQALLFALQIARGMQHATKNIPGFVHRDLKPENVLVGADKLPGTNINRLRVTDFGLIKIVANKATDITVSDIDDSNSNQVQFTHEVGTPLYMAPEQWLDEPVGVYTDVYALGCILYEMLTGQRAASGQLREAHCNGKLLPVPGDLPKPVRAFLKHSLAVAAEKRYQTWNKVIIALEKLYSGLGVGPVPLESGQASESTAERQSAASSHNEIGKSYAHMGKAQEAIGYFEKALKIASEINDQHGEGLALDNLGNGYAALGQAQVALGYFEKALGIFHELGHRREEGHILSNIGDVYRNLGEMYKALEKYEKYRAIAQQLKDQRGEGNALCSLGLAYFSLGRTRDAINCFEKYLEITREIKNQRGEGIALGNLGNVYSRLGDQRQAIGLYKQYLQIALEIGDRVGEGNARSGLGNAYLALRDIACAIYNYKKRLKIAHEIGDRRVEGNALGNLATAYATLGDVRGAINYYEQQLSVTREIGDRIGEGIALSNLGLAYADLEDIDKALEYAKESVCIFNQIGHIPNVQRAQKIVDQITKKRI